jgi:hypothetical protein
MKEVISWLVRWACRAGTRDICSALATLVGPVQNIFSSRYTISIPLSPSPSKQGRQPCWVACLLVCASGKKITNNLLWVSEWEEGGLEIYLCVIIYRWFGRSPENMKSELKNLISLDSVSGKLSKRLNY